MTGIRTRSESAGLGMLLAAVGGYLDAYTFVQHRIFANAQTGNVVLGAVDVSARHWADAASRLPPIVAFLFGVVVAETLGTPAARRLLHRPLRIALGAEVVLLAIIAALPDGTPTAVVTVTVSFVAAVQFATFRTLVDAPYTTLLASGNLRSLAVAAHRWLTARDRGSARRAGRFTAVVLAFVAGAIAGAVITRHLHMSAVAVAAGMLAVALAWLIRETRALERHGTSSGPAEDR